MENRFAEITEIKTLTQNLISMQLGELSTQEAILAVTPQVKKLCADASWLPEIVFQPNALKEELHIIYEGDDNGNPMIILVCWPPGIRSAIHDHLTWAVVGCLIGLERDTLWRRLDEGREPGYCELEVIDSSILHPGEVISMNDEVMHQVDNIAAKGTLSISLHVYGRDLRTTNRNIYYPETHRVCLHPNTEFKLD